MNLIVMISWHYVVKTKRSINKEMKSDNNKTIEE